MRFSVQREAFLKPLRVVAGVVERKSAQVAPVLQNVLIQLKDQRFYLTTTDQEVELVSTGPLLEKAGSGAVTVSVRKLMDICRTLPEGGDISVKGQSGRLLIQSGRSRFTLSTLPADEFPGVSDAVQGAEFSMASGGLKRLIEQTGFAMADQDVRYYLNGMLFELRAGKIYSISADGHRLAFSDVSLTGAPQDIRAIVPRKSILELQRILPETDEPVRITLGSNHIRVRTSEAQLTSKLLEGRFPDYQRILSTIGDKVVLGRRESLKEAFQRAATVLSDKFKGVRLKLSKGTMKILATNAEQDEVEEDLEVDYDGDELEIGFNIKYLIDFLNAIPSDHVKFTLSDANSSARVEGVDAEHGVYVIMPMRI